jgi:hypothetical protein
VSALYRVFQQQRTGHGDDLSWNRPSEYTSSWCGFCLPCWLDLLPLLARGLSAP